MKRNLFETALGLAFISLVAGMVMMVVSIYSAISAHYEFNVVNFVLTLGVIIVVLGSNLVGKKILEVK
jgi:hypothetical protein